MKPNLNPEYHRELATMLASDGQPPTLESHIERGRLFANGQHCFMMYSGSHASAYFRSKSGKLDGGGMYLTREYLYFPEQDRLLYLPAEPRILPTIGHLHNDSFLVCEARGIDIRTDRHPVRFEIHRLDLLNERWTSLTADLGSLLSEECPLGLVHDLLLDDASGDLVFLMCRFRRTSGKARTERIIVRCRELHGTFEPQAYVELADAQSFDIALVDNESGRALVLRESTEGTVTLSNLPPPAESGAFPYDWKILQMHDDMQICGSSGQGIFFQARTDYWTISPAGHVAPWFTLRAMTAVIGEDGIRHEFLCKYS